MSRSQPAAAISAAEFNRAINAYPWFGSWTGAEARALTREGATIRLALRPEFLRQGGSVSGPIVMFVADRAMYAAVMGASPAGEDAVTADMTLHFLRRPVGKALLAEARILRLGRRTILCAVEVRIEGEQEPVAHVVGSYALPRR